MSETQPAESHGLRADCGSCFALCCVAPAFSASVDFAVTKKAGQACANLQPDLSQSQLDAARGDATTKIPAKLARPAHWPGPDPGHDHAPAA